jgi:hypothetical protein
MPDGTSITGTSNLHVGYTTPFYQLVAGNTSSIAGSLSLSVPTPGTNTLGGSLSWMKHPSTSRYFPGGFSAINYSITGGVYTPPVGTALVLNLSTMPGDNAHMEFNHAKTGLIQQSMRVNATGLPVFPTSNPKFVKIAAFNPKTGDYKGTFRLTSPGVDRTATFEGQLSAGAGHGYFLINDLPAGPGQTLANTPFLSGTSVLLPGP